MSTERKTESIPGWKHEEVDAVTSLIEEYDSVGVVDITGIPSRQLQDMRRDLYGTATLRVSRNTLLVRALEATDGASDLTDYVSGQVGLIGTNENPFGLFGQLESSKTSAPINAGETAPNDIVVPEGDTGMDPGPFVGELQSVGANARIDDGSIKVLEDSTVLTAGEAVSGDLASVLSELDIEPKEVGLDLRAVYAEGVLFEAADLELDVDEYRRDVSTGVTRARNLAVNAGFPTAATMPSQLARASSGAKSLAIHATIEDPDVLPDLIARADSQVRVIASQVEDTEALPDELRTLDAPTPESQTTESTDEDDTADRDDTDDEADDDDDGEATPDRETGDGDDTASGDGDDSDGDDSDGDEDDAGGDALGAMFG